MLRIIIIIIPAVAGGGGIVLLALLGLALLSADEYARSGAGEPGYVNMTRTAVPCLKRREDLDRIAKLKNDFTHHYDAGARFANSIGAPLIAREAGVSVIRRLDREHSVVRLVDESIADECIVPDWLLHMGTLEWVKWKLRRKFGEPATVVMLNRDCSAHDVWFNHSVAEVQPNGGQAASFRLPAGTYSVFTCPPGLKSPSEKRCGRNEFVTLTTGARLERQIPLSPMCVPNRS